MSGYARKRTIRLLSILLGVILAVSSSVVVSFGATTVAKPKISSLKSTAVGTITVKSNKNTKVTGYQIKYSLNKNFSSAKTVKYTGKQLNKKIKNLKEGRTYYVKIRAFKTVNGSKKYSKWSVVKNVKTKKGSGTKFGYKGVYYTSAVFTKLYKKQDLNASNFYVWYNTKLTVVSETVKSTGSWFKVRIGNGSKTYYLWIKPGENKLKKADSLAYSFVNSNNTKYQNEVIEEAMSFLDKDTEYDFEKNASDGVKRNGKYKFHCSGFATYVINKVMQQYVPAYRLTANMDELYAKDYIYNQGQTGQLKTVKFGKGAIDYDKLQPGDLIFFKQSSSKVDHVAIYLGNKMIIQSTKTCKGSWFEDGEDKDGGVCIAPLTGLYKDTYVSAMRVLPTSVKSTGIESKAKKSPTKIYKDWTCDSSKGYTEIPKGSSVKVLYTYSIGSNVNAYVSAENSSTGKTVKGFMFKYKECIN